MPLETDGPHNAPNQFYNSKGQLTSYALHCGYVEKTGTGDYTTTMYHEGACYHIRTSRPQAIDGTFFSKWDTAQTLTGARKVFARHIRAYHRKSRKEVAN